jgi:hypothetical protein
MTVDVGSLSFAEIEARIDAIVAEPEGVPQETAAELLAIGETVLEAWVCARGEVPTRERKEGFRLLALHRQGARSEPSFNACREACRELAYHYNLITHEPDHPDTSLRITLAGMVARHLVLFIGGKSAVSGLGSFYCSAKPVRVTGH